jgi:hypothetical protein
MEIDLLWAEDERVTVRRYEHNTYNVMLDFRTLGRFGAAPFEI